MGTAQHDGPEKGGPLSLVSVPRTAGIGATSPLTMASAGVGSPPLLLFDWRGKRRPRPAVDPEEGVRFLPRVANRVDVAIILSPCFSAGSNLLPVRANVSGAARRLSGKRITKPLPFAETRATLLGRTPSRNPGACNLRSPRMLTSILSSATLPRGPSVRELASRGRPTDS